VRFAGGDITPGNRKGVTGRTDAIVKENFLRIVQIEPQLKPAGSQKKEGVSLGVAGANVTKPS